MLLNAIDNLIRKAKLITNDDQKRIALLLSPIMQLQIKKELYAKILILISQFNDLDISIITRWATSYVGPSTDQDVKNEFYINYAKIQLKNKRYEEAKTLETHIPNTDETAASIYYLYLARTEVILGKPVRSIKYYKRIKDIDGLYPISLYELIFSYEQAGMIKKAVDTARKYLSEFRDTENAKYIRRYIVSLYIKSNNPTKTKEVSTRTVDDIDDILAQQEKLSNEMTEGFFYPKSMPKEYQIILEKIKASRHIKIMSVPYQHTHPSYRNFHFHSKTI